MSSRIDVNTIFSDPTPISDVQVKPARSPLEEDDSRKVAKYGAGQQKKLFLPVSESHIDLSYIEIDPCDICVPSYNKRIQSLLKTCDPKIESLIESIRQHEQSEPILLTCKSKKKGSGYELVYGSRRLFAIRAINKGRALEKEEPLKIRCWIGDISKADATAIAKAENEERADISAYEQGVYYKALADKGSSREVIAAREGFSVTNINASIRVASIDIKFVKLLKSPSDIKISSGLKICKIIDRAGSQLVSDFLSQHKESAFESMADMHKSFKSFVEPTPSKVSDKNPKEFKNATGEKVVARINAHRKNRGQYKIDLFDFDAEKIKIVNEFIGKISGEIE